MTRSMGGTILGVAPAALLPAAATGSSSAGCRIR